MGRRLTAPERNVAAEARALEDGHRAIVQDGGWVKVVSESYDGKWYRVEFVAHTDGLISFSCRPDGREAFADDHLAASAAPGSVPCKHAALAARRLERERMASYDGHGRWSVTPTTLERIRRRVQDATPANLLQGLPR